MSLDKYAKGEFDVNLLREVFDEIFNKRAEELPPTRKVKSWIGTPYGWFNTNEILEGKVPIHVLETPQVKKFLEDFGKAVEEDLKIEHESR